MVEEQPRDTSGAEQAAADAGAQDAVQGSANAGWDHLDQVPGANDAIALGVEQLAAGLGISHVAHAGDHVLGELPLTKLPSGDSVLGDFPLTPVVTPSEEPTPAEEAWGFPPGTGDAAFGLMSDMAGMEEEDDDPDA